MELTQIKSIGLKSSQQLNKMGIATVEDLLEYYPFRYEIIEKSDLNNLVENKIIIDGIVENTPRVFYFNKKLNKLSFRINTNDNLFNVNIFNRAYLKQSLQIGSKVTVIGKIDDGRKNITANNIKLGLIEKTTIDPVYHMSNGETNTKFRKIMEKALEKNIELNDYIPIKYQEKYKFKDKQKSIFEIHKPSSLITLKNALDRAKYEEMFIFMLKMNELKNNKHLKIGLERKVDYKKIEEFISKLPFILTKDQLTSVKEIYEDLTSKKRMNRLLQGDVGSGKTIIAIIAMYINYLSGYQSTLMAPTEILANQHYQNIKELFEKYNIEVALLTGKLKAKEKREIYKNIKEKKYDVIIGTHALFTEEVEYNNLGLVITDEQHRFGVNQRSNLKNKGITPDVLYMSATPIPRTYALTLYGDMDISSIKTPPNGKKEIITTLKKESEIKDVLTSMLQELKQKHQIYVVAPLIEESDKIDLENVLSLEEKMNKAFGKYYKVGILHGKMSSQEKDEIMNKFKNNEIQILISTTVIEVGINVENATMIVIFDSFRFGLSALHQLRGRVGRNTLQSYCILISNYETERLNVLTKTNDGFKISEEDFKLRGSGDLFGQRQSGLNQLKLSDFKKDYDLLLKAKDDSEEYMKSKEYLNDIKVKELLSKVNNLD